jgi:hypothetical protein
VSISLLSGSLPLAEKMLPIDNLHVRLIFDLGKKK